MEALEGVYLITGNTTLAFGISLNTTSGAYSLTGFPVSPAEKGAYVLTGSTVSFNPMHMGAGAYGLTGVDTANRLDAESGNFALTGSIFLDLNITFHLGSENFSIIGSDLSRIHMESGSYLLTPSEAKIIISMPEEPVGVLVYYFTLSGSPDIELGIKSFQARMRTEQPTFLQVITPDIDKLDEINIRSAGEMKIEMAYLVGDMITNRTTIITATLDSIKSYEGGENKTITLVGYDTKTYVKNSIQLYCTSYKNTRNGVIRYRLPVPNIYLHPGYEVTIENDTFIANVISYFISVEYSSMEISEE